MLILKELWVAHNLIKLRICLVTLWWGLHQLCQQFYHTTFSHFGIISEILRGTCH